MKLLWILLLLVPFLFSLIGSIALIILIFSHKRLEGGMIFAFVLFSVIAAYLFRLLVKSFEPGGGLISIDEGSEDVNLSWGGKEPGFFTYVTYLLLGPMAFFVFNKGKFPSFPHPQTNITTPKRMTMMFLGATYLVLIIGAIGLFGLRNMGIWLIVGLITMLLLIPWLATMFGILMKVLKSHN
jgi:hypothetical protein